MQGVTHAKAVQKHFEHMVMHSRMHVLFRAFRRRGFLTDIIDSINTCTDFGPRPLPVGLAVINGIGGSAVASTSASDAEQGCTNAAESAESTASCGMNRRP